MREPETAIEHHPSCQAHCHRECGVSPRRGHREGAAVQVRTFHGAPVIPPKRPSAPLWERIDDWAAVQHHRDVGCDIVSRGSVRTLLGLPLPATDGYERAARHDLDGWMRRADVDLDDTIDAVARERKRRAKRAPDVGEVAEMVRDAFPALTSDRAAGTSPPVVKRPATERQRQLLALATGEWIEAANEAVRQLARQGSVTATKPHEVPTSPGVLCDPMYDACEHIRDVFTAMVWALALILFGRERDTISDYALGRLLKGEPVKDVRPPFASASHALAVASRPLPGLGGGSCAWPTEDPRMRQRTWSKAGEMSVKAGFHGTDHIRGEAGVHRVLDARNVERRAALEPHERAAVAVLDDRELNSDQKATRLREVEAVRRGLSAVQLADDWAVHDATRDISDDALFGRAVAARQRVRDAVDRVSREGDALAPKREQKPKRRRVQSRYQGVDA